MVPVKPLALDLGLAIRKEKWQLLQRKQENLWVGGAQQYVNGINRSLLGTLPAIEGRTVSGPDFLFPAAAI